MVVDLCGARRLKTAEEQAVPQEGRRATAMGPTNPIAELFDLETKNLEPCDDGSRKSTFWLREQDSNLRPFG